MHALMATLSYCFLKSLYRIERPTLDVVWNREMITGAYRPRIMPVATPEGRRTAIAFVVNPEPPRYSGRLTPETQAAAIAVAEGRLGSCAQYLFSTVERLDALGINDGPMHDLKRRVERKWRQSHDTAAQADLDRRPR